MSQQYPGGFITKTAQVPSGPYQTSTAPGVWTLDQAGAFVKAGNWPTQGNIQPSGDAYWAYVQSLLHGDGTNGANNNTILDSSSSPVTLTRGGKTTQGTFSPYGSLWSNFFEGGTTYMSVPTSTAFNLGTGDFTAECWVFRTGTGTGYETMLGFDVSGGLLFELYLGQLDYGIRGTANNPSGVTVPSFQWVHLAITRQSGVVRYFQDGSLLTTYTGTYATQNFTNNTPALISAYSAGNGAFNGYISNLRLVKGTALYTASFTPSTTPLTAVSGTSLLTCQSNSIKDNSSNNATITRVGGVAVTRFSPFSPGSPGYTAATYGGSILFPQGTSQGSTDANPLRLPNNSTFNLSGDFTYEFWIYAVPSSTAGGNNCCVLGSNYSSVNHQFGLSSSFTTIDVYHPSTGSQGSSTFPSILNSWAYVAYVRSGSTLTFYLNGVSVGSVTNSQTFQFADGCVGALGGYGGYAAGYMTDVKLTKSALYSGSFTPPSTPVTSAGSSILWLQGQNGGIPDNAMLQDWYTNDSTVNTSIYKYGTGSIYFNGTSSYLETTSNLSIRSPAFERFGLKFTIEFWIYRTSTTNNQWLVCTGQGYNDASGKNTGFLIGYFASYGGGSLAIAGYNLGAYWFGGTSSIAANQWVHCAVVGDGTNCVLYINGINVGSNPWPGGFTGFDAYGWTLGAGRASQSDSPQNFFGGYIDDFRITNGVARYTANFTPPTAAFGNY